MNEVFILKAHHVKTREAGKRDRKYRGGGAILKSPQGRIPLEGDSEQDPKEGDRATRGQVPLAWWPQVQTAGMSRSRPGRWGRAAVVRILALSQVRWEPSGGFQLREDIITLTLGKGKPDGDEGGAAAEFWIRFEGRQWDGLVVWKQVMRKREHPRRF